MQQDYKWPRFPIPLLSLLHHCVPTERLWATPTSVCPEKIDANTHEQLCAGMAYYALDVPRSTFILCRMDSHAWFYNTRRHFSKAASPVLHHLGLS